MSSEAVERRLFKRFAEILEYPQPGLVEAARECQALVALLSPSPVSGDRQGEGAAALLREFCAFVETTPLGRLQEVYSGTFDLDATYHPYVGYHLLGETYKRSVFLIELKERYRAHGFEAPQNELPDHLAVLLRFLAACDDPVLVTELVHEALVPALERMAGKARSAGYDEEPAGPRESRSRNHPYRRVLEALQLVLQGQPLAIEA